MGTKTIIQLGMIALSLFLVFAVVMPKLDAIKVVQDEAAQYQNAVEKAELFNQQLASLLQKKQNFGKTQLDALDVYLPFEIDSVEVLSDISTIIKDAGLTLTKLAVVGEEGEGVSPSSSGKTLREVRYDNDGEEIAVQEATAEHIDFTVMAQGNYESFKKFLTSIEFNKYQLEIISASMQKPEVNEAEGEERIASDAYNYTITLRAYSFKGS